MDKIYHFTTLLFMTSTLLTLSLYFVRYDKAIVFSLIFLFIFSIGSEYIQHFFFPDREFSYLDMSANLVGMIVGVFFFYFGIVPKVRESL